jgi:hypothetical protein
MKILVDHGIDGLKENRHIWLNVDTLIGMMDYSLHYVGALLGFYSVSCDWYLAE